MSDIYQRDPAPRLDSEFEPGALHHLVPGNEGRMLDLRRTPVRIVALEPEIASWVCEVMAFEDRGALWMLPFESIVHYQFERDAARASAAAVETFEKLVRRFDVLVVIAPEATLGAFEAFMAERDLLDLDPMLASVYVSNPGSGERVKGHMIVMAEMGLAPYRGRIVRDPAVFAGDWRRARRADHILWRAAFVHALLAALGLESLELHRGVSGESEFDAERLDTLESWSFHRGVAEGVAAPEGAARAIHTRHVPPTAAFMTYLETRAMNRQFLEAEAVLIAGVERGLARGWAV